MNDEAERRARDELEEALLGRVELRERAARRALDCTRAHSTTYYRQSKSLAQETSFTCREYSRPLTCTSTSAEMTIHKLFTVQCTSDADARSIGAERRGDHLTTALPLLEHWRRSCDLAVRTRTRTSTRAREEHMRLRVECEQSSRTTELYCSVVSCHVM